MNRILFESDEIREGIVRFDGARADHVLDVLHGEVGQTLKTGVIDGRVGSSVIVGISSEEGRRVVTARCAHAEDAPAPWADLVLAPPRPRALKRLLPQLASLGVGKIYLVGAKKVEKDFWGATLLKSAVYRPLLIDGLMQAGTSRLPTIETRRNFRKFVREELDAALPSPERIVAHPYGESPSPPRSVSRGGGIAPALAPTTLTLAIGPEGGWTDDEVALLEDHGFRRHSLGPRILRTDTATIALLAQLMVGRDGA